MWIRRGIVGDLAIQQEIVEIGVQQAKREELSMKTI